uniref:MAM domain-containing protein n=1 Tax=Caenorhabditis japonica TaxID=281687 RepID=A0A8R1I0X3_CAEJA
MTVPASPQYIPVNGLDQSAPIPPPPPPPASNSVGGSDQLEMINEPDRAVKMVREITPYPGYIPPPPAPSESVAASPSQSSNFPTLIDNSEIPQNHVRSSHTFRSDTPLQLLSPSSQRELSCPFELSTITDFLTCIRRLSTVTLDEHNISCDFEKDSGCRFKSISSPLSVGNFASMDHYRTFATLANRLEEQKPSGNFVFFIEHRGTDPEDEFIMSTPITCQKGNGVLKFDYWIVGKPNSVMLRVCTQNHLSRSCTQSIAYNSATSTLAIEVVHPNSTFFELEIVASNLVDPTVIVYDNIEYKAELCEFDQAQKTVATGEEMLTDDTIEEKPETSVDSFFDDEERQEETVEKNKDAKEEDGVTEESVPVPSRPIRLSPRRAEMEKQVSALIDDRDEALEDSENRDEPQSVCKLLSCDFDQSMCLFNNYVNESMSLSPWQLGNNRVGNPHTGVREGSGFLYVGTDSSTDSKIINYILESPDLSVEEDVNLTMDIYRRSNDITLQICLDTPFYCPYSLTPFDKETSWKEGEMFLVPRGTLKVYIKAIQWRKFKWLAIDNLRVVSASC